MESAARPEAADLLEMIGASWMSQAVCVAAELRVADHLAHGEKNIDALAQATRCHAASLRRLMRALASLGLCVERGTDSFELTSMGSLLREGDRYSLRSWAIWWGRHQWAAWGHLLHCVRTGESARKLITGHEGYGHHERDPEIASIFNRAMVELTQLVAGEVLRVYDFSGAGRLVDVGGGYGKLLATILAAHPGLRGILFDLPHAVDGAAKELARSGVSDRCEVVAGSFLDSVPHGADTYLLKSVLHNWDDRRATAILANCRRAMSNGSTLVLVERVMPTRIRGSAAERAAARTDLHMLVGVGGRERTESEFAALLASTGFELKRSIPIVLGYHVIEGRRARPQPQVTR